MSRDEYFEQIILLKDCIIQSRYYSGRAGKKIHNAPPAGKTPLKQLRYQDKRAALLCECKIDTNFTPEKDYWITLTYGGCEVSSQQARRDIDNFIRRLRRKYRQAGNELKYILTAGRTQRGAIHFHMILNAFDPTAISKAWQDLSRGGYAHIKYIYKKSCSFQYLAEYIIKNSREDFYSTDKVFKKRFCESQNLQMPRIVKRPISIRTFAKDTTPPKGYILDKNSVYNGYGYSDAHGWHSSNVKQCRYMRIAGMYTRPRFHRSRKTDNIIAVGADDYSDIVQTENLWRPDDEMYVLPRRSV